MDQALPSSPPSQGQFRVQLQKEQLVFSAAHFITFAGNICERLHGHNYAVRAEVAGRLDENRYVIDFIAFRDALAAIVARLDHRMLLPATHPHIQVTTSENEVTARFEERRWLFPAEDCLILPVSNTTAEELARWIALEVRTALKPQVGSALDWLEVGVDENNGQWGICRIDW
ncbi:MAG: 6-pyruvoyl tetrahydrobiopterin synthase [Pirellulaceae bacterium]|nr:MAG: 6-pyruvoyl tetrahydrobiopterin synthase [Pirellulaceae bacterium]